MNEETEKYVSSLFHAYMVNLYAGIVSFTVPELIHTGAGVYGLSIYAIFFSIRHMLWRKELNKL